LSNYSIIPTLFILKDEFIIFNKFMLRLRSAFSGSNSAFKFKEL